MSPDELGRRCGVDGTRMRGWLRVRWREGHPLLEGHSLGQSWEITAEAADQLEAEYRTRRWPRAGGGGSAKAGGPRRARGDAQEWPRSDNPGHRVVEDWMGVATETLRDLLRPGLRAALVGWNPTPRSVAAGHYYQGRAGRTIIGRLRRAGLVPERPGHDDDLLYAAGIGFTDIAKRPTAKRGELTEDEVEQGAAQLERAIAAHEVQLVIFTFAGAAKPLLGFTPECGLVAGQKIAGANVFAMPGRWDSAEAAAAVMKQLARLLRQR